MRFYDARSGRIVDVRNARLRFFFLGPFLLLWLRLWADAAACAVLIWAAVHGAVVAVASALGVSPRLDSREALRASRAVRDALERQLPADDAFARFMDASIPFYTAAIALLLVMGLLTIAWPHYLRWRFRRTGLVELSDAAPLPADAHQR